MDRLDMNKRTMKMALDVINLLNKKLLKSLL
jgi:hypothetical protein